MTTPIHLPTRLLIVLAAGLLLVLALAHTSLANATPPATKPAGLKSAIGSVIRTKDVEKTRSVMKKYGLKEAKTVSLPQGGALITVSQPVNSSKAQHLQQELRDEPHFSLFPNYSYRATLTPNDPLYTNNSQWNLPKISAPQAWDVTTGSSNSSIAVIDSGVLFSQAWAESTDCPTGTPCTQADFPAGKQWTNPGEIGPTVSEGPTPNCTSQGLPLDKSCNNLNDDSTSYIDDYQGWDFMGGFRGDDTSCPNFASPSTYQHPDSPTFITYDNDPQPYSCDSPTYPTELNRNHYDGSCVAFESACYTSHGTSVGSVAAAATNNNQHVAGVDWNAKIMNLRALDGYGWGDSSLITAAVEYATAMNADVINLSLAVYNNGSCTITDTLLESALADAKAAGIVIVAAAGNDGTEGVCYPARSSHVIAAGATTSNDTRAGFSNYGPRLDVVAPGASVPAAQAPTQSNGYSASSTSVSGTSFASPHVAGVASLIKGSQPTLRPEDVKDFITHSADKVAGMNGHNFTNGYGYGRLNASQAVQAELPDYEPLDSPRALWLPQDRQKTNLLTTDNTGKTYRSGLVVEFDTKTVVDGVMYLRSEYDTTSSNHLGIPYSQLEELPDYEPLLRPRDMQLEKDTQKTNLLTLRHTGKTYQEGRTIRFESKITINGTVYLRTQYDTDNGNHLGIPYRLLRN